MAAIPLIQIYVYHLPPPNFTCDDVGAQNIEALPPDPHGFDPNNDRIGCESVRNPPDFEPRMITQAPMVQLT